MPTPSPSPSVYVVMQSAQGWWQEWGATVLTIVGSVAASLIVALVALRGVKEGAKENSQALIDAETERATNARDHDDYRWLRGAKAKAYFGIIASTNAAKEAARQTVWFTRPKDPTSDTHEATNEEGIGQQIQVWNQAVDDTLRWAAEIHAVGNPEIAVRADGCVSATERMMIASFDAKKAHTAETPYDHKEVGREHLAESNRRFKEMVALIRHELGSDNAGVPDSATSADSSGGPQPDV